MEATAFRRIALIGKANHSGTRDTLATLQHHLCEQGYEVVVESRTAAQFTLAKQVKTCALEALGEHADIAVVVGGDGNMLGAARVLCEADIAVIGVNRGNLGFLTELDPQHVLAQLDKVLQGEYITEKRFLLSVEVYSDGALTGTGRAINEVVLHSDKVAHMIEFEVYIDDHFVYSQRSDGLIVATPTGSTAYSLSGGGPILTPTLDAISMVPMFPHALSSRPIVVPATSCIRLRAAIENDPLQLSCDGHARVTVTPGDEVIIKKHSHQLRLIQPLTYSYYNVLRSKLNWGSRLF